jgi:hypothetical protein
MKRRFLCFVFAGSVLSSHNLCSQGIVSFSSVGAPADKRVYFVNWYWNGWVMVFDDPVPLGAGYQIALYWGPAGATDDRNLVQIGGSANFLTGTSAGTFFGGHRTITGIAPGAVVAFQARAWNSAAGNSYEQAINSASGIAGKGPVFEMKTKDPGNALETTPNIWQAPGWRGFRMGPGGYSEIIIPEPSTISLGVLGLGAVLLGIRRR